MRLLTQARVLIEQSISEATQKARFHHTRAADYAAERVDLMARRHERQAAALQLNADALGEVLPLLRPQDYSAAIVVLTRYHRTSATEAPRLREHAANYRRLSKAPRSELAQLADYCEDRATRLEREAEGYRAALSLLTKLTNHTNSGLPEPGPEVPVPNAQVVVHPAPKNSWLGGWENPTP